MAPRQSGGPCGLSRAVLDQTHVRYSYKQHCMVSLTVADAVDQSEWHLPTYDPRNETKYHYKLHSLDAYFWTQQDALQFVNGVRRVLPPHQVEVLDEPAPLHASPLVGVSSVVQQLERAAVSDPQYGAGAPTQNAGPTAGAVPPPPPPQGSFVPMPYNPAAPAAPETIRHREKTPPLDDDPLNPLAVAVAHDYHKQPFTPGLPTPSQPGMPLSQPGMPPLQQPAMHRAATMPAGLASPFGPSFPASPRFVPSQTVSQPTPPIASPGDGYTHGPGDYSIHQQVYRPSSSETHQFQPKQEARGKLEENAGRLERGVTGMLKKFEKKFG